MALATSSSPMARRALLASLATGLAAGIAGVLGRAAPAAATHTGYIDAGTMNSTSAVTVISNTATNGGALAAYGSGSGVGLQGSSDSGFGVTGGSSSGPGVSGSSNTGSGVNGSSLSGHGVYGESGSGVLPAIVGRSLGNNSGLMGHSGTAAPPASPTKTGVYGYAAQDAEARGVTGQTTAGWGVSGIATTGTGVFGGSTSGYGVFASSDSTAGFGWSVGDRTGLMGHSGHAFPPASPARTGVFGHASQDATAVGVRGTSATGRGGVFKGPVAQLRLQPAGQTNHPASGQKGDLVVDTTGRLWFCKGGSNWNQLA